MAADTIKEELSSTAIVARYGGEEFVVVLPGEQLNHAIHTAERLAKVIRAKSLLLDSGEEIKITSSIGVTQYKALEKTEETLKRVDDLLYHAKEQGRDRVISAVEF